MNYLLLLQYSDSSSGGLFGVVLALLYAALIVFFIACGWKIFTKADRPGWKVLIPLYNLYVQLKIVGRPGWWLVLFLIPLVNIIAAIIVNIDLAKSFGKGTGYGLALTFLGIIFIPMLASGDAQYQGPAALQSGGTQSYAQA